MRITEQSRYALMVLATLAKHHPDAMTVAEIAAETGITEFNLFKLMKTIAKSGYVASSRGRGGGVRLARPPDEISIGQILRMVEPRFLVCAPADLLGPVEPRQSEFAIRTEEVLGRGIRAFLAVLDEISITDAFPVSAPPGKAG